MCGIVAVTGYKKALPLLINGLEKLEYRGYDSAGIAIINSETNVISCNKAEGKLKNLISNLNNHNIPGTVGIGHTRWATHGKPEVKNAHPHTDSSGNIAVVQNGIIENFQDLKNKLEEESQNLKQVLLNSLDDKVLGPVNAPIYRVKGKYRQRLLIRSKKESKIQNKLAEILNKHKLSSEIKLTVDVDPITFN